MYICLRSQLQMNSHITLLAAGADYEAAHDAVARQAEASINGRAPPAAGQPGPNMAPPQRPTGPAPPGMGPPPASYGAARPGMGAPPQSGAPTSNPSFPGEQA